MVSLIGGCPDQKNLCIKTKEIFIQYATVAQQKQRRDCYVRPLSTGCRNITLRAERSSVQKEHGQIWIKTVCIGGKLLKEPTK